MSKTLIGYLFCGLQNIAHMGGPDGVSGAPNLPNCFKLWALKFRAAGGPGLTFTGSRGPGSFAPLFQTFQSLIKLFDCSLQRESIRIFWQDVEIKTEFKISSYSFGELNSPNTSPSPTIILNHFPLLATCVHSLLDNLLSKIVVNSNVPKSVTKKWNLNSVILKVPALLDVYDK